MSDASAKDRRQHARHPLPTSVQFFHGMSEREFPGRCVDISKSGMMMYVPASVPIKAGDPLKITLGSVPRPEFADLGHDPSEAMVVRVDRNSILRTGHLAIGLRFMEMAH